MDAPRSAMALAEMDDSRPTDAAISCWCGTCDWRPRFRTRRFGLLECRDCGTCRIDPMPVRDEAAARAFYADYYERSGCPSEEQPPPRSRFWDVARRVPELAAPAQLAVDVGCGEGHLCAQLHQAGWEQVVGIDVSSTRLARARRRYPHVVFLDGPLAGAGLQPRSADLVVLDNVIEHLPDPVAVLRQAAACLAPGGRCALITPNMESGSFRMLGRRWTPELAPHAHVYLFHARSMARVMARAGLLPVTHGSFPLTPFSRAQWTRCVATADLKHAMWQAGQELGGLYGRLLGAGGMLYAVGVPAQ